MKLTLDEIEAIDALIEVQYRRLVRAEQMYEKHSNKKMLKRAVETELKKFNLLTKIKGCCA